MLREVLGAGGVGADAARRRVTERQSLVSRVKALAEALEDSDIGELDLTENGVRIVIRRRLDAPYEVAPTASATARRRSASPRARSRLAGAAPLPEPGIAIIAPLTGVAYLAASPTSAPFVRVGDSVQAGQTICIVEAMKVFNEVKSEMSGMVTAIIAQSGQLVQKGDALIRVTSAS